jgi:arylsulfatase A-like enzyme
LHGIRPQNHPPHRQHGRGGYRFERAFATAFWTLPSHGSLFTGLCPTRAGATSETNHLPLNNLTLAEVFQQSGYHTAAFVCNAWLSAERGFAQGFDAFFELWRLPSDPQDTGYSGAREKTAVRRLLGWLDERASQEDPFFVFINLNCAHMPYQPPEPFRFRFLRPECEAGAVERLSRIQSLWPYLAGEFSLSKEDFCIMNDLYDGEVAFADHLVGRIVQALRSKDLLDHTLLVVTSDHGENLGDHGRIDHLLSMHETTLHVPLIFRFPGRFPQGAKDARLVSLVDIAPTILDACGFKDNRFFRMQEGRSLCREEEIHRSFVLAENDRPVNGIGFMKSRYPDFDTASIDFPMRAIRSLRYKLIWEVGRNAVLYDLSKDPDERHDLAETDPQTTFRLKKQMEERMQRHAKERGGPSFTGRDEENLKILRAMGYVD